MPYEFLEHVATADLAIGEHAAQPAILLGHEQAADVALPQQLAGLAHRFLGRDGDDGPFAKFLQ